MPKKRFKLNSLTATLVPTANSLANNDRYIYDFDIEIVDTHGEHKLVRRDDLSVRSKRLNCILDASGQESDKCIYPSPNGNTHRIDFKDYVIRQAVQPPMLLGFTSAASASSGLEEEMLTLGFSIRRSTGKEEDVKVSIKETSFPPPGGSNGSGSGSSSGPQMAPSISKLQVDLDHNGMTCDQLKKKKSSYDYTVAIELEGRVTRPIHRMMDHELSAQKVLVIFKNEAATSPSDQSVTVTFSAKTSTATKVNPDGLAILFLDGHPDRITSPLPKTIDRKQAVFSIDV